MNPNEIAKNGGPLDAEERACPECGHAAVRTVWQNHPLHYGSGADAVELQVRLPVRECPECNFRYLDDEAEELQHEAVCKHLGLLTPTEIKALRKRFKWSQQYLADLTDFGIATVSRWECGRLLQNRSANKILLALRDCPEFREYVEGLLAGKKRKQQANPDSSPGVNRDFSRAKNKSYTEVDTSSYVTLGASPN